MEPFLVAGIAAGLAHLILDQAEDHAQVLNAEYMRTGRPGSGTTRKITNAIDRVLKEHRYAKIGKTVRPAKRLQATDYRKYHTMYLVYETTSDDYICHYESLFIKKYRDRLDNKHENSTGRVANVRGKNYLYVVVAD